MSSASKWMQEARRRNRVAQQLATQGHMGDAVSRAYFALVAAAQGVLLTAGARPKTHKGMRNRLGYHFVRTGQLSGEADQIFEALRQRRSEADYDMRPFSPGEVNHALRQAEQALDQFAALL